MHKLFLSFFVLALCAPAFGLRAQNEAGTKLRFHTDGTFKTVQFTDLHYIGGDARSDAAFLCTDAVVEAEKPDFIIITGDIIFGAPAVENFRKVMEHFNSYGIPFGITFGNHDRQFGATDSTLLSIARGYDMCVTYEDTLDGADVSGDGNCAIPVYSPDGKKVEYVFYCFDSHEDSRFNAEGIGGYDFIRLGQIEWYARRSAEFTAGNGGEPVDAAAFFHIPLPEYEIVARKSPDSLRGDFKERVSCPDLNSGLFAEMKEMGDVHAIFCGHDHDSDWTAVWQGILLSFGRYSGGSTVYFDLGTNGGRVTVVNSSNSDIHTWVRLSDGSVKDDLTFALGKQMR